jgi:hypothetical protein
MSGDDVMRVGLALSRCASGATPMQVFRRSIPIECEAVGMIRGKPPAFLFEPHYRKILAAVQKNQKRGAAFVELALLQLSAGRKLGGVYENHWRLEA